MLQAPSRNSVRVCRFCPLCCPKYGVQKVWRCAWPLFSDTVLCRTGDSHNYCGKELNLKDLPSRKGNNNRYGCQWMQEKKRCCHELFRFLFFRYRFLSHIKVCSHYRFCTFLCFPALPLRKHSVILFYIKKIRYFIKSFIVKTSILQIILISRLFRYIQV